MPDILRGRVATTLLSAAFAIDGVAVITVTTAHGLGYTPATKDVAITVVEDTADDTWTCGYVKIASVGAADVVAKVKVTGAGVAGSTAKLAIKIG